MVRVGVIGARKARQGIGFHLTRFAHQAGAEIVGIVGATETTAEAARDALGGIGVDTRVYPDGETLLTTARPDVLIIASPSRTHEAYLRLALAHGVHVLCEKPLCWGGADPVGASREIVDGFLTEGLHLGVNAQWPYTLDTYRRLFPAVLKQPPRTFRMRLSPRSHGVEMLPDAVPHALSLLAAVLPDPEARLESPAIRVRARDETDLEVTFTYRALGHTVEAAIHLKSRREQPREAGYGFDERPVRRTVDLTDYRLSFEAGTKRLELPDPTPMLVGSFLAGVSSSAPVRRDLAAWPAMAHLATVARVWDARTGVDPA